MNSKSFIALAAVLLLSVLTGTAHAAPVPESNSQSVNEKAPDALKKTFNINVVFVGYAEEDIDTDEFVSGLATTYNPLVISP